MTRITIASLCAVLLSSCGATGKRPDGQVGAFGLVVHGGAGTIRREKLSPELEAAYRGKLEQALRAGHSLLAQGGSSLDAVEETIRILEDSPLFNAGKGAVFNAVGANELDASIMDGESGQAGAVAAVRRVKNPIRLARLVMERTRHVLLAADGAEEFAKEQGVEIVSPDYFYTERRKKELERAREREKAETSGETKTSARWRLGVFDHLGTVGAAALDASGNLAAGTSTGGLTNKKFGRIGDSPIIGAGTFADNDTCAVSATGHGEYFIRAAAAHEISALMRHAGASLQEAADRVVHETLLEMPGGGRGGVIAIDRHGNVAMPFNTPGMYRGYTDEKGRVVVKIFGDD